MGAESSLVLMILSKLTSHTANPAFTVLIWVAAAQQTTAVFSLLLICFSFPLKRDRYGRQPEYRILA
jgi:hypothetical protein